MAHDQPDFFGLPADISAGFWSYHRANPDVYRRLVEMATDMVQRGRKKLGMGMLFEVLRWEYFMADDVNTEEPFMLNNNYRAFYTRLIERNVPHLNGVFTKRASVSDEAVA